MAKIHQDSGQCEGCLNKINEHPNFNADLAQWFIQFQAKHPEAHIACAWRNKIDQDILYSRRATKAQWPKSAHNWGAALDIFCSSDPNNIFPMNWYAKVLKPEVPEWMAWYGRPGAPFWEQPHVEVSAWNDLVKQGKLFLNE